MASLPVNGPHSTKPAHSRCPVISRAVKLHCVTRALHFTTLTLTRSVPIHGTTRTSRHHRPFIVTIHDLTDHNHTYILASPSHKPTPTLLVSKYGEILDLYARITVSKNIYEWRIPPFFQFHHLCLTQMSTAEVEQTQRT